MNALITLVFFIFCCVTLGGAIPTPQNDTKTASVTSSGATSTSGTTGNVQVQQQVMSNSNTVSSANGILVKISQNKVNNECVAKLTIQGKGIDKTMDYPCGKAPINIINLKEGFVVGDEWFSDQPKTLVHLSGKQCQKEVFTEEGGKTSSTSETLSDAECQKVRTKISELKSEQQKWYDWLAQKQLAAQQQVQQNVQWIQNQLFGGLFGGN